MSSQNIYIYIYINILILEILEVLGILLLYVFVDY